MKWIEDVMSKFLVSRAHTRCQNLQQHPRFYRKLFVLLYADTYYTLFHFGKLNICPSDREILEWIWFFDLVVSLIVSRVRASKVTIISKFVRIPRCIILGNPSV